MPDKFSVVKIWDLNVCSYNCQKCGIDFETISNENSQNETIDFSHNNKNMCTECSEKNHRTLKYVNDFKETCICKSGFFDDGYMPECIKCHKKCQTCYER